MLSLLRAISVFALALVAIVALVAAVITGGTLAYMKWLDSRPSQTAGALAPQPVDVVELNGLRYGEHTYWIRREGGNAVAVFTPILPRDDAQVLGAAESVAKATFGVTLQTGTARLIGPEISVLSDEGSPIFVLPIKQGTGEIHTLRLRRGPAK